MALVQWRKNRYSAILVAMAWLLCSTTDAWAQPRAFFQWGTSHALDNRINLNRVPVRDSAGSVKYYDVALTFNVDNAGKLSLNTTATKITQSPELVVGAFRPGIYEYDGCEYPVGTPGVVSGGRISGSIGGSSNCGAVLNVAWVSGPIIGHPNEATLRAAGITFQGYSWGIVGNLNFSWTNDGWKPGDIVGVVQSGQQLIIHNFGDDNREDMSAVFTLCPKCT
jgi:hypothetical protein